MPAFESHSWPQLTLCRPRKTQNVTALRCREAERRVGAYIVIAPVQAREYRRAEREEEWMPSVADCHTPHKRVTLGL